MNEKLENKDQKQKADKEPRKKSLKKTNIRIRPSNQTLQQKQKQKQKRNNSPLNNKDPQTHQNQLIPFQQNCKKRLKDLPKILQFQSNGLVQGHLSYIDEGREKWKIGKIIGKGNSSVRKAINVKTGVISAVKQLTFSQQQELERISQIQILQKINHNNIVSYIEHYKDKNYTLLFMQYVPTNLRNFYQDFGPPPPQVFLKFAKQIVSAMAYLQKNNIIHKDIKCQNILINNQGVLKLCDFGCSKDFRSTWSLKLYQKNDAIKSFKGSYLWTAPQCLIGKHCLASDIWSLGCSFVELISGRVPWYEKNFDNHFHAIRHIVQSNQTPQINQQWHPKIKLIIKSCLKRQPSQRITAVQLLEKPEFWE